MSFAARRLLRTNTAALRRAEDPQAANTQMRTGPNWTAITVAIIGVSTAYFVFGKGEADSAKKKAAKENLNDPAVQKEPGGGASKVSNS